MSRDTQIHKSSTNVLLEACVWDEREKKKKETSAHPHWLTFKKKKKKREERLNRDQAEERGDKTQTGILIKRMQETQKARAKKKHLGIRRGNKIIKNHYEATFTKGKHTNINMLQWKERLYCLTLPKQFKKYKWNSPWAFVRLTEP